MPSTCEASVVPATGADDRAVIRLSGEVDGSAKDVLPRAYTEAVASGDPAGVLLDFHAADYINSTGIAVIVGVLARARSEGRRIAAVGLTEHYLHIFAITRLVDFIDIENGAPASV